MRAGALVGALGLTAVGLSGCSAEEAIRFGWPAGVTKQAEGMLTLWIGSAITALIVGVIVWGLIFWAVARYRLKPGQSELPKQTRENNALELTCTAIPIVIVLVLFYFTVVVQNDVDKKVAKPDVTIGITAFKWNWKFSYPSARGADGQPVSTLGSSEEIPVLVVPTGSRIRFTEESSDVIHSFWVPDILFKRDVIPGRVNTFEVDVTKPGAFVGRCAELCGTYHANMNFEMRAVPPAQYQQWLKLRQAGKSNPDALGTVLGQDNRYAKTTRPFLTDRRTSAPS